MAASLLQTFQFYCGLREQIDGPKAKALIAEWQGSSPIKISISNKSFGIEAAEVLAAFLDTIDPTLQVADISDIIASRPEEEALQVMRCICEALQRFSLLELNVSDNALGAKGIEACRAVLSCSSLQSLFLCNNGLSAEACQLVSDILLSDRQAPPLRLLHFYNNMSGDGGAIAVAGMIERLQGLEDVRCSATRAGQTGSTAIAKALSHVKSLVRLDLSDNSFGSSGSTTLAESLLKHSCSLQHLNLRDDNLDLSALLLATRDSTFPCLLFLDLSGNDVDASVAEELGDSLRSSAPSLETLLLDDNDLEEEGARAIAKACASLKKLKKLSLCNCALTGGAALYVSRVVINIQGFQSLEMNGNIIGEGKLQKIRNMLKQASVTLGDMDENDGDEDEDEDEEDEAKGEAVEDGVNALVDKLAEAMLEKN